MWLKAMPVSVLALAAAALVVAQDGTALDGSWTAQWRPQTGGPVANAEMTLQGSVGTWRAAFASGEGRANPCLERAHPVSVKAIAPGRFRLTIEASKTMQGCRASAATLELTDAAHLSGAWGNGQELKLTRK